MSVLEPDPGRWDVGSVDDRLDLIVTTQLPDDIPVQPTAEYQIAVPELSVRLPDEGRSLPVSCPLVKTAKPLRILMVATEAPPVRGGIARTVGYLRDGLQERGHHVDVLAYPEIGRFVLGEVRLSKLIFNLPRLLRHSNEYDVIHVHGITPTVSDIALLFTRFCNPRPLVIYTHHMDLDYKPLGFLNRVYNHLHHGLSTRADVLIASTRDSLRLLGNSRRGVVIPIGVDLEHFSTRGPKDTCFTVLFVGQFRPYKGVPVLLRAMAQVANARLLLAGQGPEEQAYRSLAMGLGLDVEFHIGVNDAQLRQLYQRAHVVVMPSVSRLEAFGIVLVEGMTAGCVPIASDLPGVREVVGRTDLLFPVGDANQLAEILRGLRDDRVLVQQISDYARAQATKFGQERIICEYEKLITGLIASRNLQKRIALDAESRASVLHAFTSDVGDALDADWTEIVLRVPHFPQDKFYTVASMRRMRSFDHQQFQHTSALLAQHAIKTGDSTLIGPHNGSLYLKSVIACGVPTAIVTPLTRDGKHFGALLSMRERPFDRRDLESLVCFARYAASPLYALVKEEI